MIPVFKPSFTEEEISAVTEVIKSGWWGTGPKTMALEKEFSDFLGIKHAIAVNSATAALDLAYGTIGIKGKEVITTPMTFISTNHMILKNGGIPVFCDIEPDTLNIDVNKIEKLITKKTKAIVVVHYGGHACDMKKLISIVKKHKLFLIEDSAHAAGSEYEGKKLGTFGDISCFSFHAVKNLASGDGGMAVTNNDEFAEKIKLNRWMGITKNTWERSGNFMKERNGLKYDWYYDVVDLGHKFQLTDILASIARVQLRRLKKTNKRRREIRDMYNKDLRSVKFIKTPVEKAYTKSANHNYVIKTPHRDELHTFLNEKGISTGVHYIPNNLYKMYKRFNQPTPIAHAVWKEILTLPLFPDLTDKEVKFILNTIKSFKP